MQVLCRGKVKTVYDAGDGNALIVFRDEITAGDGVKREVKQGKGAINAEISARLFQVLEKEGIPTHYLGFERPDRLLVRRLKIIPVEVIVRNIAAGSLVRRYPFKEGAQLASPIVELGYKSDEYHDPMLNEDIAVALSLCTREELAEMRVQALKVNDVLKGFFTARRLLLVDFKLEFGRSERGELLLGDEISPDTCRLWDLETREVMDKDRFRRDMGGVIEHYREVLRRVLQEG